MEKLVTIQNETFEEMKIDFDLMLNQTLRSMRTYNVKNAVLNLKLNISMSEHDVESDSEWKRVMIPSFMHDVSTTMQIKDNAKGFMAGEYCLVEQGDGYVLKEINPSGQMNIFDNFDDAAGPDFG